MPITKTIYLSVKIKRRCIYPLTKNVNSVQKNIKTLYMSIKDKLILCAKIKGATKVTKAIYLSVGKPKGAIYVNY